MKLGQFIFMQSLTSSFEVTLLNRIQTYVYSLNILVFKGCPMDKVRFGDKCLVVKGPETPIQGHDHCQSIGGDLVSIESHGVQQFLQAFLQQAEVGGNVWIGKTYCN